MADDQNIDIDEQPKKKGPLMLIIIVVNVLLIGGAGAFFMLRGGGGGAGAGADAEAAADQLGTLIPIESFIVNLNEPKSTRYLKITFSVELAHDDASDLLAERKDVVRDRVLTYLSGLTIDDVRGSETKETIRQMIVLRTNEALNREDAIRSVLFTEFVVQ